MRYERIARDPSRRHHSCEGLAHSKSILRARSEEPVEGIGPGDDLSQERYGKEYEQASVYERTAACYHDCTADAKACQKRPDGLQDPSPKVHQGEGTWYTRPTIKGRY